MSKRCQMSKSQTHGQWRRFTKKINWYNEVHTYWHQFWRHIWWWPKTLKMGIESVFEQFWWFLYFNQNWHQYMWTSLCEFIFFVNLLHSLCVWLFDIWQLFNNLTSFWHFDIFFNLNHLSPSQGYFFLVWAIYQGNLKASICLLSFWWDWILVSCWPQPTRRQVYAICLQWKKNPFHRMCIPHQLVPPLTLKPISNWSRGHKRREAYIPLEVNVFISLAFGYLAWKLRFSCLLIMG